MRDAGVHTISQLPHPNIPRHILIKHLKTPTILFRLAWIAETTRSVKYLGERVEINYYISAILSPQPFSVGQLGTEGGG